MKMKKLMMAAFAALTLFSCSKEDTNLGQNGNQNAVNVKFVLGNTSSKSIDDSHPSGTYLPKIKTITIYALDGSNVVLNTFKYTTQSAIDSLIGTVNGSNLDAPVGKKIVINSSATQIKVIANETDKTNINDIQGFDNVPVSGTGTITKGAHAGTEADPYTATVTIAPDLARFEVFGAIKMNLVTNGYYAVDVEEIFINNTKLTAAGAAVLTATETTPWTNWYAAYNTASGTKKAMFDKIADNSLGANKPMAPVANKGQYYLPAGTATNSIGVIADKAAGYNMFPQKTTQATPTKDEVVSQMPHIVLRVKTYLTESDYNTGKFVAGKEFITIRSFTTDGTETTRINNMAAGNIYSLDLNDLSDLFTPTTDPTDPDPEGKKITVEVKVTVTKWTATNVKPEI